MAIARALVGRPAIVLADEPTGNLDSTTGASIMALLRELNAAGATILMITHDAGLADQLPRQIRVLDGRVVCDMQRAAPGARRTGCAWRASGCAPGRCAPRCPHSGSRSARRRSWRSSACPPPPQAGLLAEIDRLGTNLLTVEAGQSFTGEEAELPVEAPARITHLGDVQQLAHTALLKDERVYRSSLIPAANSGGLQVRATSLNLPSVLSTGLARGRVAQRGHGPGAGRRARRGRRADGWASTGSTPISGSGWAASGSTSPAS